MILCISYTETYHSSVSSHIPTTSSLTIQVSNAHPTEASPIAMAIITVGTVLLVSLAIILLIVTVFCVKLWKKKMTSAQTAAESEGLICFSISCS